MSNVLEFRPASAGGAGSSHAVYSPADEGLLPAVAQIIIFPGVRYERVAEPCEPSPKPSRGGKGRSVRRAAK